ncbi:hypothetical protein GCM10008020_42550 [Massilia psychrophila]|uniref:Uncharacterized protein n=1 Tax=Pseudoalteromonas gelatinilytica TaxID=1703256 RepID=A0ABQ1UEZ4_9GAMM|nr:hypothetical protein GCM10008020_42550 [Massilia psychrophila]GGF15802.1 hypothetical protein GCM10008027_45680 [Pseudoalteromonas profundi]
MRYLCTVKIPRPLNYCHWAGWTSYIGMSGGDVFGKQARLVFAEFLPFLLVFPYMHSSVGVTMSVVDFSQFLTHIALFVWAR